MTFEQNGRGCGYAEWHDDPLPKFLSDLLGDLRDEVWRLRAQENVARPDEETGREAMVLDLQDRLKKKDAEIAAMKEKFSMMLCVFTVFLVGVFAGKMFS